MANKILIPVDFSSFSNQAVAYACQLPANEGATLVFAHIFTDHSNIYHNATTHPDLIDPRVAEAKRDMEQLINSIQTQYPSIKVETIWKDGNLYDEIKKNRRAR